jgi:hypothetical protein
MDWKFSEQDIFSMDKSRPDWAGPAEVAAVLQ